MAESQAAREAVRPPAAGRAPVRNAAAISPFLTARQARQRRWPTRVEHRLQAEREREGVKQRGAKPDWGMPRGRRGKAEAIELIIPGCRPRALPIVQPLFNDASLALRPTRIER
jgi:hypothetical protein